jgi:hypothetical protein
VITLSALSIRNLDDRVTDAVAEPGEARGLFQVIMDRFGEQGGVELDLPPRATGPRAAEFGS